MTDWIDLTHDALRAFDLVAGPVWVFAHDGFRLLFANASARALLGCDDSEAADVSVLDAVAVDHRSDIADLAARLSTAPEDLRCWTFLTAPDAARSVRSRPVTMKGAPAILSMVEPAGHPQPESNTQAGLHSSRDAAGAFSGKVAVLSAGDHRIIAVTDDYTAAMGLARSVLIGRGLCDFGPPRTGAPVDDTARILSASLQRAEKLRAPDLAGVLRYPVMPTQDPASDRLWLVLNTPVLDDGGQVTHIVHRIAEMTDLKDPDRGRGELSASDAMALVEGASATLTGLHERDQRLRVAEGLLGLGVWNCDLETHRLSWSPRVFEMNGRSPELGEPSFEEYMVMTHPDDRHQMRRTFDTFMQSGVHELDYRHRVLRPDGSVVHLHGVGRRERVQGRDIVIGCVLDETEAMRLQSEVQAATRLQRMAGLMSRLGFWRYDVTVETLLWSDETALIHEKPAGFSPSLREAIEFYAPEDRGTIKTRFEACIANGEPFEATLRLDTARGNRIWVRSIGEPVRDAGGRIVAVEGAFQDVSELLVERDRTRAQSRRLRQTLEHISDGFYLLDPDWRFAFVNSEAERLLRHGRDALLGKHVWDVFPDTAGSTFDLAYRKAVETGQHARFEAYSQRLEGWFSVDAYPTPEGLAIYFRDITRTRARDERLNLLAAAVARQNDIVLITEAAPIDSPDGPRIIYVNDAFTRHTGYSAEEVIGQTPRILQGPRTDRAELDRMRGALERWEPVRAELINYTKSGTEFWVELDIVPLADDTGRFTHWVSIQRDITARREAEAAMRASEDRFRLVARVTGNAIWDWDIPANKHWWSEGLTDQFGHPRDTDGNMPTVWEDNLHPDDRHRVLAAQRRMLDGTSESMKESYRFRCADGSWATVEDHAFVIRDADGRLVRLLGSMNNVTERVQLEDRLRQSQKLEAVGQLTGGIAHDFNNLLTIILGNAETLSLALREDEALHMMAEMMNAAAERGAELTQRLLAFSRRQPLEPRVLDVNTLLSDMERLLSRTLGEHVDIEIVRAGGLWLTEVDAGQLEAAILNLALNARDAMPDGGALTIETANASLDADYAADEFDVEPGQYVVVIVTDTGHGMTPETVARAFEPFFTTKEVGKGSGLGLSMVFGFVKQSGGHVRIYSEPGDGTAVKLYFRRAPAPVTAEQPRRLSARPVGGHETILVVEDEALVRDHVVLQLRALGYTVIDAEDGHRALEVLRKRGNIDLLFTDVVMPGGMSGRNLAEIALQERPGLKVLYTSGYTENSIVHQGRLDPGVELLTKPYRRDHLAAKVRKVLDKV